MKKPRLSRQTDPRQPARRHRHTDFGREVRAGNEDDLERILEEQPEPLLLLLDGVTDPHNLGACLRTADAAGVHAVICPKDRSAGLTETVRHIACGGAESVPFIQVTNLARTMDRLKERGVWLVGTSDQGDRLIYGLDLRGPLGIVLGAEGDGMRRLTAGRCDFLARIPMQGRVECLNVSVATGVCLFEAVRQRSYAGSNPAPPAPGPE